MEYVVGASLAGATGLLACLTGFDRDRTFYPVVLIVVVSYYCLFAILSQSPAALWHEAGIAALYAAAAVIGFRGKAWVVVAGLAGHGAMDLVHDLLVSNPGVPSYWPGFCAAFDGVAALYLAGVMKVRRVAPERSIEMPAVQDQTVRGEVR
ncbi:MAG: hypothetical protein KGM18_00310 [Sphingomonadales bacterium]|nr:hypothetical protein [Sphingomonadales bacterium]